MPAQDIAEGNLIYDPTKTYMTFIVGDGDNIGNENFDTAVNLGLY